MPKECDEEKLHEHDEKLTKTGRIFRDKFSDVLKDEITRRKNLAKSRTKRIRDNAVPPTLEQLAKEISTKDFYCSAQTLSKYRRGWNEPSLEALSSICNIFNVSADYLLGLKKAKKTYKKQIKYRMLSAEYIGIDEVAVDKLKTSIANGERYYGKNDGDIIHPPFPDIIAGLSGFDYTYQHFATALFVTDEWEKLLGILHHCLDVELQNKTVNYLLSHYGISPTVETLDVIKKRDTEFHSELDKALQTLLQTLSNHFFKEYKNTLRAELKEYQNGLDKEESELQDTITKREDELRQDPPIDDLSRDFYNGQLSAEKAQLLKICEQKESIEKMREKKKRAKKFLVKGKHTKKSNTNTAVNGENI